MTSRRPYPDTPSGPFPKPPVEVTDREDRDVTIRAYESGDHEKLVSMYVDFDPADRAQSIPPIGEERVRKWVDHLLGPESLNVVAVCESDVVGHATLVEDDDEGYELAIFVHQDFQGAGIGTKLLKTVLGYGEANGVEKVWLTVERWNRAAVGLYEKVGFEKTEDESFELEMAIRLSPGSAASD
ncbi:MAG: N-acetyltransferase family protein [Halanaeroarchaeum sp.]